MITKFWDWVDSRAIVRRCVLGFTLYMTWLVTYQAWLFAHESRFDGLGTAAIIAAVLVPVTGLQGFAFAHYSKGRE